MMRIKYMAGALLVVAAGAQTAVTPAHAEEIINAIDRISLTDPATGATFVSRRVSERSWPSAEKCERERNSFMGVHLDALKEYGFVNAGGQPLTYNIEAVDCVKR